MIHKHRYLHRRHAVNALRPLPCSPLGTSWQKVGGKLQHVSVSPQGHVWGVNSANNIYIRTGTTTSNKGGNSWKQIPGSLKQISAGGSGVWGVNAQNEVYYRVGTYGHSGSQGSDWRKVRPNSGCVHEQRERERERERELSLIHI